MLKFKASKSGDMRPEEEEEEGVRAGDSFICSRGTNLIVVAIYLGLRMET